MTDKEKIILELTRLSSEYSRFANSLALLIFFYNTII